MKLTSLSLQEGHAIPEKFAFAKIASDSPITLSDNENPHLAWSDVPEGTLSFAIICHDIDVPSQGDQVNKEGQTVPKDLPRVDFYHWLLWNIPASTSEIQEGTHCQGVTPRGKPGPNALEGMHHGLNDYTAWFAGDEQMEGQYFGYDGPCPPWNDERLHHYVFTVYALNTASIDLKGAAKGADLLAAIQPHIIDSASITCTYSLNPSVLA
ncbi:MULTISPECIES: YbhB/YbcL family Raf kinase inhibitor-like protein [Nitrincola]|uniref:Kinase inhibitor protein n=1 Tax=Nitrincola nitratireducens TaxID=1229521 RepID=W9V7U9_9GAMM|nr:MULTISPECIES: YbhB/YbcL family Raf kinase inhibitor-like protein [Nitrincola]EXJ12956.1 hypothetical protein D791_00299 [Nitrincola nitratireducens]